MIPLLRCFVFGYIPLTVHLANGNWWKMRSIQRRSDERLVWLRTQADTPENQYDIDLCENRRKNGRPAYQYILNYHRRKFRESLSPVKAINVGKDENG